MLSQAPCARKPVTPHARHKLVRMARANSESFARAMMTALHDSTSDSPSSPRGLDFVDSLNGIDLYEDVARASESEAVAASTRLRSLCHIDAEIHDVVRRLTTTVSSSRVLPGIVETHELCSVLDESLTAERLSESEFPEYAGINWFVLHPEPTRDSALSRSGMFRASNSSDLQGHGPAVEFLVLAYQGIFRHRGRRGWVQWCQSIELSNFPVTPGDAKRGVLFSSGIVAVESATRRGQVGVCYAMGVDLSSSDVTERRFLENAVWKRVMKLAALKKSMARESLARTLSISSSEHERSSQSSQEVSPRENDVAATKPIGRSSRASSRSTNQPECEPKANRNESRSPTSPTLLPKSAPSRYAGWASKIQELRGQTTVKPVDKRRQRAQTMQPTPSQACPRHRLLSEEPETLEFRLSLYKDPDPVMDEFAQSPTVSCRDLCRQVSWSFAHQDASRWSIWSTEWIHLTPQAARPAGTHVTSPQSEPNFRIATRFRQPADHPLVCTHDALSLDFDGLMPKHAVLPPDFFAPPRLSDRQRAHLVAKAREAACALVETVRGSPRPVQWHNVGTNNGVQMYHGAPRGPSSRLTVGGDASEFRCGVTTVRATLDEAAAFFDVSTTEKFRAFQSTHDDLLDGVVLYTLVDHSATASRLHQVTIKWMAVRMPSRLASVRDFLTLECQDTFTDVTGRRGWVRSFHSIELPCCPDLRESMGFVRATMRHSGLVVVESEKPGDLYAISSLQVDFKGNLVLPKRVYDKGIKRWLGALGDLDQKLRARRVSARASTSRYEAGPRSTSTDHEECALCRATLNVLKRRTQCRKCARVFCASCASRGTVERSGERTRVVRLCLPCAKANAPEAPPSTRTRAVTSDSIRRPLSNHRQSRAFHHVRRTRATHESIDMKDSLGSARALPRIDYNLSLDRPPSIWNFDQADFNTDTIARPSTDGVAPSLLSSMTSSVAEHDMISFCDSVDGYFGRSQVKDNDPTVSVGELSQQILIQSQAMRYKRDTQLSELSELEEET